MDNIDIISEFLTESNENLARLDQEIVELEKDTTNAKLIGSIFRSIHTLKGTCGFLGFDKLCEVSHVTESILSQVRDGKRSVTQPLISIILEAVDAAKQMLTVIERTGNEGIVQYTELTGRLQAVCDAKDGVTQVHAPQLHVDKSSSQVAASEGSTSEEQLGLESEQDEAALNEADQVAEAQADSKLQPKPVVAAGGVEAAPGKSRGAGDSTIRVDVGLLDKLMNLVGELVLARNQVLQYSAHQEDAAFNATSQRLNLITTELQGSVMKTRMQPIGIVWGKFPRVVRDLAMECGKQIELTMTGAETELDRTIIEAIKDPLIHIVRNSCDHGVERPEERVRCGKAAVARLSLRAFHEGGHVNIEITDDGAGIDPEKIKAKAIQQGLISPEQAAKMTDRETLNTIFLPGFSTAGQISNISGRGVGMDVVKTNIEKIGGLVDLASTKGQGTAVKIKIPLTLAIIPGLVVTVGRERFVIPQVSLLELVRLEGEAAHKQIERIHGTPVYRRRGKLLPIAFLSEILGMDKPLAPAEMVNIVVLQAEDREFGLVVDGINDTQEIVVKPLGKQLKGLSTYSGATIMGDGKVALILDVLGIAQRSGFIGEASETGHAILEKNAERTAERQSLLLFRTGGFERLAVPLNLVARLEEIPRHQLERAAGRTVVQYRGHILPLVPLSQHLGHGAGKAALNSPCSGDQGTVDEEPLQAIVFSHADRLIGLVVDQILDIVDEPVATPMAAQTPGLLGSAVVGRKMTDFLDLQAVIESSGENWFGAAQSRGIGSTVLIADPSAFTRAMLRSSLEMAGYRVVEAASALEASALLAREEVQLIAASLELAGLAEQLARQPNLAIIPTLGLASSAAESEHGRGGPNAYQDYQMKFDREGILRSLERLAAAVEARQLEPVGAER
jgi:two-component system, chemotaxis family, sensor kinase CheA